MRAGAIYPYLGRASVNDEAQEDAMIEALKDFPPNVVAFVCHGHVTKDDYATVLVPAAERALNQYDKVRLYYETAADFSGIDPAAVWEDTK